MENTSKEYFARLVGNNTYIMSDSLDDRKRLALQVKLATPAFKHAIGEALDRYGLRAKLQDAQATFRVLDVGCGEGLYVPVLREFLTEQGLKARLEVIGVDRDAAAIATAQDYMNALGLKDNHFYTHNLIQPLTQLEGLNLTNPNNHFDLAFALVTLMHIPNPRQTLSYIREVLKPGGAFYAKDVTLDRSVTYPSPTFIRWGDMLSQLMLKMLGDDFAAHHAEYIKAAGFEEVESFEDSYPMGGRTELGRRVLEDILLSQHASRTTILKFGLMTEAEYDKMMEQEFREISPELEGKVVTVNTIARRPL